MDAARDEIFERLPQGVIDFLRKRQEAKASASADPRGSDITSSPGAARSAAAPTGGEAGLVDNRNSLNQEASTKAITGQQGDSLPARVPPPEAAHAGVVKGSAAERVCFDVEGHPLGFQEAAARVDAQRGAEAVVLRDPLRYMLLYSISYKGWAPWQHVHDMAPSPLHPFTLL